MFCRHPETGRRPDGGMVHRPGLRRLRPGATHMPGSYEDVVRLLVPELQRRGLFHKDYEGTTLRDTLGLPIARAADWHAVRPGEVRG